MFRNFRRNKNINNKIQNPQLQRFYNTQAQMQAQEKIQKQHMTQNGVQPHAFSHLKNVPQQQTQNKNNTNNVAINDFSNKEALMKQGIQVLPYDESNKQNVINNSANNNLKGDIVFATDEFKEKYLKEKNEMKKADDKHKKDAMKKVKFEISDIYKNELNRKFFYSSLISNCDDVFVNNCIQTILKNCNKLFSIYEKERFFKEKIAHTPKSAEVFYNRSMILFAIEEENKMFFHLINEMQNNWDYSKLNRVLIIKMYDLAILNSILAYMK